jgi:enoyl-CoA hydratase
MTEYKNLIFENQEGIGILTMNRPKALNALNTETLSELSQLLDEIAGDNSVKVVILTGAERSFVAGADITEMLNFSSAQGRTFGRLGQSTFNKIEKMTKPVIAAINGFALGGGCELAMACDIRIASEKAKFGQPEVGLGIVPGFGGTQRLPRLVGRGKAKEIIYTGEVFDAQEALRIGLVEKVVPPEELLEAAKTMARKIMKNASYAVTLCKDAINTGLDIDLAAGQEYEATLFGVTCATDDKKEGMSAFVEKRKANFTGK